MSSSSKGKDVEGTSGVRKLDEIDNYEQELNQQLRQNELNNGISDPVAQIRPYGSREHRLPSQMITTEVHMAPPRRIGVVAHPQPQPQSLQQDRYMEHVFHERLKQVKISWNHTGRNVAIVGSWDNWVTTEPLQSGGQNFVIIKILPVGIYHYRFIVDGYLTYAPEFPWACDDSGCPYNILDLQDYMPEANVRLSDFEPPPSPPSSYDNRFLNEDEFSKPPPELPPQLPLTLREEPSSSTDPHLAIPMHTHLQLNHLKDNYIGNWGLHWILACPFSSRLPILLWFFFSGYKSLLSSFLSFITTTQFSMDFEMKNLGFWGSKGVEG